MRRESTPHDRHDADLVCLYAVQALPASEVAAAEALIAACAECRSELEALRPLVGSFVSWPTDVLRPSESLWGRLSERIAAETGGEALPPTPGRLEPDWREVGPGIFVKVLASDVDTERVSMLVRLGAGTDYPPHEHAGVEELHLLDGELRVDDRKLYPGDYLRSEPGSVDHRVWSETGCTCVLIACTGDVIR